MFLLFILNINLFIIFHVQIYIKLINTNDGCNYQNIFFYLDLNEINKK